jgi:predicted DNA-binding transcriptional regulator AlpA
MDWAGGWCWLDRYELRALQAKCSHSDHRPSAGLLVAGVTGTPLQPERARCRTETRYRGEVDVERAADLYTQGWTLRQIGRELGVHSSTISQQLRSAGVNMRSGGPQGHPASTQQILELRDQGLTWNEIAEQVGMTVSGVWSRYRWARPPKPAHLGRGSRCSRTPLIKIWRLASEQPSLIISAEPQPEPSSPLPDELPILSSLMVLAGYCACRVRTRTPVRTTVPTSYSLSPM